MGLFIGDRSRFAVLFLVAFLALVAPPLSAHELYTGDHLERLAFDGQEVVMDSKYNLMWEGKTAENRDALRTWEEACDYCENLTWGGYDDWRLPTAMEYTTLVDLGINAGQGEQAPCIDKTAFPHNGLYHYWTSSEYPPIPSVVQYTSFATGNQFKWTRSGLMRTRCVRGGGWTALYPGNGEDFDLTENLPNQKTVIDNVTGLEWEQKAWYGEDDEGLQPVLDLVARLTMLLPDIPGWAEGLLIMEFLPAGFLQDQADVLGRNANDLISSIPHLLVSFTTQLIEELSRMPLEGRPLIGRRSFLMVFSHEEALAYIDWLNEIEFAGHDDWRLPTVNEIVTTTHWERVPCIKEVYSPTFTWLYRTSTADPLDMRRHFFT